MKNVVCIIITLMLSSQLYANDSFPYNHSCDGATMTLVNNSNKALMVHNLNTSYRLASSARGGIIGIENQQTIPAGDTVVAQLVAAEHLSKGMWGDFFLSTDDNLIAVDYHYWALPFYCRVSISVNSDSSHYNIKTLSESDDTPYSKIIIENAR